MKLLVLIMTFFPTLLNNTGSGLSWAVGKESSVNISGKTNVNSFVFAFSEYEGKDTLVISLAKKGQNFSFEKGMLQLPVKSFKNKNAMLTRDFKKTLKASEYPDILMNFKSISGLQQQSVAEVEITLAGKSITRFIKLVNCQKNNCLNLQGSETLRFSDFDLKPPKNVLGFITVKDELQVDFSLVLKQIR